MVIADEVFDDGCEQRVAVLEWRAWNGFLLTNVLGDCAARIETDPFSEFPSEQFERVCDSFPIVCFHINLSVRSRLPLGMRDLTERFVERGVFVVNGLIQDIRKSTLQAHLEAIGLPSLKAARSGDADEILFVKTDLNYGGDLERWLPPETITAAGFERLISADIGAYHYNTVERRVLEDKIWTDPSIVIEKYVSNDENSFFRTYFSGQQIIIVKAFAPGIIKKLTNDPRNTNYVVDLESLKEGTDDLPLSAKLKQDVVTFVENTPAEFGCIDIVHDGHDNHYVVDLNLTPYAGEKGGDDALDGFLRLGIVEPSQRKVQRFLDSPLATAIVGSGQYRER